MESVQSQGRRGRANSDWIEKQQDLFVRMAVDDFLVIFCRFQDLYAASLRCRGHADCTDFLGGCCQDVRCTLWVGLTELVGTEKHKGPLWSLKDLCHRVWQQSDHRQYKNGSIVDWLVGSIFHEAMKLKENLYLLNTYGPAAVEIEDLSRQSISHFSEKTTLVDMVNIQDLVDRIAVDVSKQMEQIGFLFGQTNYILRMMVPELAENMLVVRLLAEKEELVRRVWGESLESVYRDMFYQGPEYGFCTAGRSYLGGQWYEYALKMYRRALAIDPSCDEAVIKAAQLEKILRHQRSLFEKDEE